jgi:hypothetical protein
VNQSNPSKGHLDDEVEKIHSIMKSREPELQRCYDEDMETLDESDGANSTMGWLPQVTLKSTIRRDGWVKRATVEDSNVDNPNLERCVVRIVSWWRFPPLKKRPKVVVTHVFEFRGTYRDHQGSARPVHRTGEGNEH